jgi:hypothetical protein
MIRATTIALTVLMATAASSQTVKDIREAPDAGKSPPQIPTQPPEQIPDVPAGTDPMNRQPDPAAGTPAAKASPNPAAGGGETSCRVRRADTDTGFVVVCEEEG